MTVRDHISLCHISRNDCLVSFYTYFFDCIADLFSILIFCKIGKGTAPVVCLIQCQRLSCVLSIRQEIHRDRIWTDTILIIIIFPLLGHWYFRFLWSIAVRDRIPCFCIS